MTKNIQLSDGIELLDGSMFSYTDPDVSNITIQMLADVLSRINRFAGHTKHFYSVAQHALNCSLIVAPGHEMDALLHDTAEAFTNDLTTPLKALLGRKIKQIETGIEKALADKFGTTFPLSPEVKLADLQMLGIEKDYLKPSSSKWAVLEGIDYESVRPMTIMGRMGPDEARTAFLNRYKDLSE